MSFSKKLCKAEYDDDGDMEATRFAFIIAVAATEKASNVWILASGATSHM